MHYFHVKPGPSCKRHMTPFYSIRLKIINIWIKLSIKTIKFLAIWKKNQVDCTFSFARWLIFGSMLCLRFFFLFLFSFMLEISINARAMTQRIRRQPPNCSYVWRLSQRPNETYRLVGGSEASDLCVEWTIDGSAVRRGVWDSSSTNSVRLESPIIVS